MRCSSSRNAQIFTYCLENSLYVPLTSRCNSVTLPCSRGPNFLLSSSLVSALCRVRDAEQFTKTWAPWIAYLDQQDAPQRMPNPLERVVGIIDDDSSNDPCLDDLLQEIHPILQNCNDAAISNIAFAGEGEPILRLATLLALARNLHSNFPSIPLRLVTNGLTPTCTRKTNIPKQLLAAGISHVSVALMTHHSEQYNELMLPRLPQEENDVSNDSSSDMASIVTTPHERVCDFIRQAVECGMTVEATGVDRHEIDKERTEALATRLGSHSFRWRTYFP